MDKLKIFLPGGVVIEIEKLPGVVLSGLIEIDVPGGYLPLIVN